MREECPHEVAPKDRPYDLKPDEGEEEIWEEISQTLVRIAGEVSPVRKTEWQEAIEKFLKAPLTTQDEKDIQKIPCWYRNDLVVKKSIEDLKSSFQEVQCGIEHLETSFEGVQAGLQGTSRVKESIENLKSSIQKVQHAIENLKTSDKGVQAWLQGTIHIMDKGQYLETEVREEAEGIKDPEALNRPIISLGSLDKENPNFIWIFQTNIARWEGEGSPILRTMFQHFV